jgi:hypothetical protein
MANYSVQAKWSPSFLGIDYGTWFRPSYDFEAENDREAFGIAGDLQRRRTDEMSADLDAQGFNESDIALAIYFAPDCADHLYRKTATGVEKIS